MFAINISLLFLSGCGIIRSSNPPLSNVLTVNARDYPAENVENEFPGGFVDVEFLTDSNWIGYDTIEDNLFWKTTDKGRTWKRVSRSPEQKNGNFLSVVDENLIYFVTRDATLLRTTDGGDNWTQTYKFRDKDIYLVYFVSETTGWAAGATWTPGPTEERDIGFVISLYKTEDGGMSWSEQRVDGRRIAADTGGKGRINDIWFTDEKNGWAVGTGIVLSTKDGGANWKYERQFQGIFDEIKFVDKQIGWMRERLLHASLFTTDGGSSWKLIKFPSDTDRAIGFVMNRFGEVVILDPFGKILLLDPNTGKTTAASIEAESWKSDDGDYRPGNISRTLSGDKLFCLRFDTRTNGLLAVESQDEGRTWK